MKILKVRSDHGGEFENELFELFCEKHGIIHEFSSARTPQQNGVVERKNRSLQEMARTMFHENNLAKHFWAEAVNRACYVQNRIFIRPLLNKIVARMEAIRLRLSYAVNHNITLYQMDVKSAFLNGVISEEVFVKQPPGFEDLKHPDYVYKLKKSLYCLKQAPGYPL